MLVYPTQKMINNVKESIKGSLVSAIDSLLERVCFPQDDPSQRRQSRNLLYEDMIAPTDSVKIKEAERLFNERIMAIYGRNLSTS